MENVSDVTIHPCSQSRYIKPIRIQYTQNGEQKTWDLITEYDDVAVLVFNTSRQVFVFVQQFRPAIYINRVETHEDEAGATRVDTCKYPGSLGVTLELCAGIMDKEHSPQETAQMELLEECGYKVPLDAIRKITSFRAGVGTTGSCQTLFYAEVTDAMRVGKGGGLAEEGELIDVIEASVERGRELIFDETVNRPVGMLFALQWFFGTVWTKMTKL